MKNIEDENPNYSLEKLRQSNDIAYKWATHFKFAKKKYFHGVLDMYKNKNKYIKRLNSVKRKQFCEDFPNMFYALEAENEIIKQYLNVVNRIIKFLKIESNLVDHYRETGIITLRSSIWNYRTYKDGVKFITFCYNGVFIRLRGERSKLNLYRKRKKRVLERLQSDIFAESATVNFSNICTVEYDMDKEIEHEDVKNLITKAISISNLKEDEVYLLTEFMNRDGLDKSWNSMYRKKFPNAGKDGGVISRQGVHNKLMNIQRRIYFSLKKLGYNFDVKNAAFAKRYKEFEVA